jgi:hypothetical protein
MDLLLYSLLINTGRHEERGWATEVDSTDEYEEDKTYYLKDGAWWLL